MFDIIDTRCNHEVYNVRILKNISQDKDVSLGATNCHLQAIIFRC